jgi:hypothetical protein
MKNWILILAPTFLMITAPDTRAHDVVTASGNAQGHQHVYRRQQYGKPLQQGHLVQSSGASSTILWGSVARYDYGKSTVRRDGPIIGDQKYRPGSKPRVSSKYGSAVSGYGKAVNGYGKPVNKYGKPDRNN